MAIDSSNSTDSSCVAQMYARKFFASAARRRTVTAFYKGESQEKRLPGDWKEQRFLPGSPAQVILGVICSLALTRLMKSMLFGVKPWDPATIIVVVILLSLVTLLAAYLPARRASRVDPIVALRYE